MHLGARALTPVVIAGMPVPAIAAAISAMLIFIFLIVMVRQFTAAADSHSGT